MRKSRDPITGFKDKIISANLCSEEELKEIDKRVRKEIDDAVAKALKEPEITLDALYTDIYRDTPEQLIRGATPDHFVRPKAQTTKELLQAGGEKSAVRQ